MTGNTGHWADDTVGVQDEDGHASAQGEIWKICVVHFQIKVRSRAARAAQVG